MKRHHTSIFCVLLLTILLSVLISGCNDNKETKTSKISADNAEFEAYVSKLGECFSDISAGSQLFFRENRKIPFTTNTEAYRVLIKEGITTCEKWETSLKQLSSSENTKNLIQITREYANNQKLFYKHLLNYAESGKFTDIQLSNKYSRTASEKMKTYNTELIKILKKNDYFYEIKDGYINFDSKL